MPQLDNHHRAMLESESGIKPEVIETRGYETVKTKARLEKLGFSVKQREIPALLIPIHSPTGTITLYQARPDDPRRNNQGKTIKYETPAGASMALDVHPFAKVKIGDPKTPLIVTEGIKKADALISRGLCAVGLIGVWNFRGRNADGGKTALAEWEFIALNGREVYIVFDSDVMQKKEVHAALVRLKNMLEHMGAKVKLIYLPSGGGAIKQGVDDYLAAGHSVDDLLALASSEVRRLETEDKGDEDEVKVWPYAIRKNIMHHLKEERVGKDEYMTVYDPLCNFRAQIIEERIRDDGVERTLVLVIDGALSTGEPLGVTEVAASQFAGLNWTTASWGSRAVVNAGQGKRDHLRAAIQTVSGNVPRRTTYTHLGWREIDGEHYFLHAGGVIGPDGPDGPLNTQVEAPQGLEGCVLPEPPTGEELKQAVRASLEVLDLADDAITVPLLGMVYRAPLGEVDFGGHLAGQTGEGKSELAAIYQQHLGPSLDARSLPGSWSSTANALEGLAFSGKDVLIVVDDFAPEGSSYDIQRYHATAARLFRAQGNNAARGRMRADGSLRPNKPPRGLILSTGEDIPKGHSIKARALILELERGALDWQLLTVAQRRAANGVYAAAMAGFVQWIALDYAGRTAAYRVNHGKYREELQSTGHKRTVDAGAQLLATYNVLLAFALDVGAITNAELADLWQRIEAGIQAALEPQAALQAQSDPVARFSELLSGLFTSGRAHVADATTGSYPGSGWGWESREVSVLNGVDLKHEPKGARIGWLDGESLYLEPSATYAELQRFSQAQGDSVPVTERTLWKRLAERGLLRSREAPHSTIRKQGLAGAQSRTRVLHLASIVVISGPSGPTGPSSVPGEKTDAEKVGHTKDGVGQVGHDAKSGPNVSGPQSKSGPQETPSGTGFGQDGPLGPQNKRVEVPPQVQELHRRWKAGHFDGVSLDLRPGERIGDLGRELRYLFVERKRPNDAEKAKLLEIAVKAEAIPEAEAAA